MEDSAAAPQDAPDVRFVSTPTAIDIHSSSAFFTLHVDGSAARQFDALRAASSARAQPDQHFLRKLMGLMCLDVLAVKETGELLYSEF